MISRKEETWPDFAVIEMLINVDSRSVRNFPLSQWETPSLTPFGKWSFSHIKVYRHAAIPPVDLLFYSEIFSITFMLDSLEIMNTSLRVPFLFIKTFVKK